MPEYTLWFTRKNNQVKGPFPARVISQHLLLGRLHMDDEVSSDQKTWRRVGGISALVPAVMKADLSDPANQQLLEMARRNADERLFKNRHADDGHGVAHERRSEEPDEVVKHRAAKAAVFEQAHQGGERTSSKFVLVIVALFISALIGLAMLYSPPPDGPDMDCSAAPAPGVNWSNCQLQGMRLEGADLNGAYIRNANIAGSDLRGASLEGADLAYSNISLSHLQRANLRGVNMVGANLQGSKLNGANLSEADLSYVDFLAAELSGANLQGARLDHAVWVDKRVCAVGSVGECR